MTVGCLYVSAFETPFFPSSIPDVCASLPAGARPTLSHICIGARDRMVAAKKASATTHKLRNAQPTDKHTARDENRRDVSCILTPRHEGLCFLAFIQRPTQKRCVWNRKTVRFCPRLLLVETMRNSRPKTRRKIHEKGRKGDLRGVRLQLEIAILIYNGWIRAKVYFRCPKNSWLITTGH